jgi:hopanoid-associated phosphorylase
LGQLGETAASNPVVARGVDYLLRTQEKDGSWFGRRGMNYIYGTWSVLCAFNAVARDPRNPEVQKAAAWLKAEQGWRRQGFAISREPRWRMDFGRKSVFPRPDFPGFFSALSWLWEIFPPLGDGALPQPQGRQQAPCPDGDVARSQVIAVTGLKAEARIATGPRVLTLSGCGDVPGLARRLEAAVSNEASAIISFGIAGGLAPGLAPGTRLVARSVVGEDGVRYFGDPDWSERLSCALGGAAIADIAGVDFPVSSPDERRALHLKTGALATDTESHVAARAAAANKLPFAAFRVVADPAHRQLPHAALVAMRPDGSIALGAILGSLMRDPRQIPQLMRTANDARAAFVALFCGRKMLAGDLGFNDFARGA